MNDSQLSFEVTGKALTRETIIIEALVKLLGGKVHLTEEQLSQVVGLVIMNKDGGLDINV